MRDRRGGRRLAGPFDDPAADDAGEAVARLYAELGGGCCDLQLAYLDGEG